MKLRKVTAIAGAAAVLGLGLGACGSSGGSAAPVSHSSTKVVNYKAQYLADVALSNALSDTISDNDGWASRPVTAYSNALVKKSRTMLRQSWPVSARGDIHALALAALKVHDDILSRDYSGFETDFSTASAEANAVRAELGLPAVKTHNIKPARHRYHAAQQQPAPVVVQPQQRTQQQPGQDGYVGDVNVVEQYFYDLSIGDYADAWTLGGDNIAGTDYGSWVAGYATTTSVTLDSDTEAGGGAVQVTFDATQSDGGATSYAGTYYVSGGVITSASITQTG
jgi:hypothetical protein